MHVRLLARTARASGLPIVVSTVGVGFGINGPTLPSILAEPEDVANVALFLACAESSYMTGVDIVVDGGMKVW